MSDMPPISDMSNPLLSCASLPDFAAVRPEHITPALDVLLPAADAALALAVSAQVPADYQALSAALDVPLERLSMAWQAVGHLNAVVNTPEMKTILNNQGLEPLTNMPQQFGAFIQGEIAENAKLIKVIGLKAE